MSNSDADPENDCPNKLGGKHILFLKNDVEFRFGNENDYNAYFMNSIEEKVIENKTYAYANEPHWKYIEYLFFSALLCELSGYVDNEPFGSPNDIHNMIENIPVDELCKIMINVKSNYDVYYLVVCYIDRGIKNYELLGKILKHAYPNLRELYFKQNWSNDSKTDNWKTAENLFINLNLDVLFCVDSQSDGGIINKPLDHIVIFEEIDDDCYYKTKYMKIERDNYNVIVEYKIDYY